MDIPDIAAYRLAALDNLGQLRTALNASLRETGLAPACAEPSRPA